MERKASPYSDSFEKRIFPVGSEVEVRRNEDCFKGGWFVATVLNPPPFLLHPSHHLLLHKIFVEYKHLVNRNGSGPLRSFVDLSNVRPKPPLFIFNFNENDVVDAFFDDAWWCGVIHQILISPDKSKHYRVSFDDPPRWIQFSHSDLRLHMFWVDGKWFLSSHHSIRTKNSNHVIDLTAAHHSVPTNMVDLTASDDSHLHARGGELNFTSGTLVEVNFDSQDVWVPATFIKRNSDEFLLVEYYCSGKLEPVKVAVNSLHIRPAPPPSTRKKFYLLEKVDAFCDSRWLNGVVTKVLPEERYIVYCKSTKKENELHHKDVRPHVEWAGGKWVPSSSSQDYSPWPNPQKLDHACSNGYKDVHVSPEPTGITKDNVGEQTLSTIILKSWQRVLQNSGSQNANCDGVIPSNERSKGTSVNGDSIYLMPSNHLKGKTATNVTQPSKHCTVILEQSEVPNKSALIGVDVVTTSNPAKSSSVQSEDSDQPCASAENQDNCKKYSSRRKRGRPPRKLKAFAPEAVNETPNENDLVSMCDSLVLGSTYAGHMIQNMNDGKEHSNTYSHHHNKDNEPRGANQVTNLKMKRRRKDLNEIFNYKEDKNEPLRHPVMSGRQQSDCQHSDSLPEGIADETGEKQYKGKKQFIDQPVEEDVETRVQFACQDDDALHRLDKTAMKSNRIVERNNKELPFLKNSQIWEMIESMEVFKRFPQRPHFGPLYEYKEELREGLAIGNMVTFTTLVDKVSRLKLSDPRSLLDGYLECLVELERMGFNVRGVRDELKSLVSVKERHEERQKKYIEIERDIMEQKLLKSKVEEEIREVEEKIEEVEEERSLLVAKKQMKDSAIQLLHSGVDNIKMCVQGAEQEFAQVAASSW